MHYTLKLTLCADRQRLFGPGPAQLLRHVQTGDSLLQAAEKMRMSYSKAWKLIRQAEAGLGFELLDRKRGGLGGGGSELTERARALLAAYERFEHEMKQAGDEIFSDCFSTFF